MFTHVGKSAVGAPPFDMSKEYLFQEELYGVAGVPPRHGLQTPPCSHRFVVVTGGWF